jgi:hypothetical protein
MKHLLALVAFSFLPGLLSAVVLPVTEYTVIAKVTSFENSISRPSAQRFSLATPYGNESAVIATILRPADLAGREIAIPFESRQDGKELFVQPGTVFRFEHPRNLNDLRSRTDNVRRSLIRFPEMGVLVLKADGEVAEAYEGVLTPLVAEQIQKRQAAATAGAKP